MKQCQDCSIVYKFLPSAKTRCGSCETEQATLATPCRNRLQSQPSRTHKHPAAKIKKEKENEKVQAHSVINVDADGSGSDIDVFDGVMDPLKAQINIQKNVASGIRLTPKSGLDTLPGRTRRFLDEREANRTRRSGDPSKAATILFKTGVILQKQMGQKQGTRVPPQSRGFPLDDVCYSLVRSSIRSNFDS